MCQLHVKAIPFTSHIKEGLSCVRVRYQSSYRMFFFLVPSFNLLVLRSDKRTREAIKARYIPGCPE